MQIPRVSYLSLGDAKAVIFSPVKFVSFKDHKAINIQYVSGEMMDNGF